MDVDGGGLSDGVPVFSKVLLIDLLVADLVDEVLTITEQEG